MTALQLPQNITSTSTYKKNDHSDFITASVPQWLVDTSNARRTALSKTSPSFSDADSNAPQWQINQAKESIRTAWTSQNAVDRVLRDVQGIHQFAEPLLKAAIKQQFGLELDVNKTFLRLYIPATTPWFPIKTGAARTRTVSLLEAALHNFEVFETLPQAYESDSRFITEPSPSGHFDILPLHHRMKIHQFTALCRTLDIGAQYQKHLKRTLLPPDGLNAAVLQAKVITSQKAAFNVAVNLALLKNHIDANTQRQLLGLLNDEKGLSLDDQVLLPHTLTMLDTALAGIVLILPMQAHRQGVHRVIAYIPDDPEQPVKEYSDSGSFLKELTRRLRSPAYQQFFSRFVAHEQRGHFFSTLNDRLSRITWHPSAPLEPRPSWRVTEVESPHLQLGTAVIREPLWAFLYQQKFNKILNDARVIAVPTDDEDRKTRWDRIDSFLKVASTVFEVAAFVAMPFVPLLGELMLAYTVYQLLDDTFEGIVDWAEGQINDAFEHFMGVVEGVIQLGTFAAGGNLVSTTLSLPPPAFVSQLKFIETDNGSTRLWNPDLTPYERNESLPADSQPDSLGLHQDKGQTVLKLGGKQFGVHEDADTGQFRILHPVRPEAYKPTLEHNGNGSWSHEAEQPSTWRGATLMRRLGHTVDELSDVELEQIRFVSDISEGTLRRLHIEHEPVPPLLDDTVERFKRYKEAVRTPETGVKEQFNKLYDAGQRSSDAHLQLLKNDFPDISTAVARKVLTLASDTELRQMNTQARVPLRLKEWLRKLQLETRVSRAYEGLYLNELGTADTETMLLNSLRLQPGWSNQVRIEIREHSFDGPLRNSIGDPDAPERKVLIRRADGQYEARDAQDNHLHGASDVFESILRALPDTERDALGYTMGQGSALRQALTIKPLPHSELRTILAEPLQSKTAEKETLRLLKGPGDEAMDQPATGQLPTLEQRIHDLYPDFSSEEISTFAESSGTPAQALQLVTRLERELAEMIRDLGAWLRSPTEYPPRTAEARNERSGRQSLARALTQCWQRTTDVLADESGNPLGQHLVLRDLPLNTLLKSLPELKADFSHVALLDLSNSGFSNAEAGFLKNFNSVRSLLMRNNHLTAIPAEVYDMPHLRGLALSDNPITLSPQAVGQLRALIHLEHLAFVNSPLGRVPDVSRMPRLEGLYLENTGIETWPVGIFGQPRPRNFYLGLQNNPLTVIPEVAPGSARAEILARTLLSRDALSAQNLQRLDEYIESVGLAPSRQHSLRSELDSVFLLDHFPPEQRRQKLDTWEALEAEPGSEPFFNEIRKLPESQDYTHAYKTDLTRKVWRMLEAASENTTLRERLFLMATAPSTCVDAAAQLFNSMGIEVLIHEAYALVNKSLVETELLRVAKGKSRLDELSRIARGSIREREANGETFRTVDEDGNVTGTIDEVEVHLAYTTALANRLDLPWQSRGMNFPAMTGVTPDMIELAFERVLFLEQGDLLRDSIIDQSFWKQHITGANRRAFKEYGRQTGWLIDLQAAQKRWVNAKNLPRETRDSLKETLHVLAAQLGKPVSEVFTGQAMSAANFDRDFNTLVEHREALLKKLTREAMDRAGL